MSKIDRNRLSAVLILTGNLIFAFSVMKTNIIAYAGLIIAVAGICLDINKIRQLVSNKIFILILLFLLWGTILTLSLHDNKSTAFLTVFLFAGHWLIPFSSGLCIEIKDRIRLKTIFFAMAIIVGLLSVGAYLGFYNAPDLSKEGMLWGFHHHIAFAAISMMAFFVIYNIALTPGLPLKRVLFFSAIALLAFIFAILAGSRGYWLAGIITFTAATIYNAIIGRARKLSLLIIGIGIVVVAVIALAFPQVRQRYKMTNLNDANYIYRKNMAIMASYIIRDHPIMGIGPGQIPYAKEYYDKMDSLGLIMDSGYLKKKHLHNMYLQISSEFGLIGLAIFLSILILSLIRIHKSGKYTNKDSIEVSIGYGVFWGLITIMIGEMFDCLLRGPAVAMIAFWLIGSSMAINSGEKGDSNWLPFE